MVQVLPEVPTFGQAAARSLGAGISHGLSNAANFGEEILREKFKRGLVSKQANAEANLLENRQNSSPAGNNKMMENELSSVNEHAVLNPNQVNQEALQRYRALSKQGILTNIQEQRQQVEELNNKNKEFQSRQMDFLNAGRQAIDETYPTASPQTRSILEKKAEAFASGNLSPAEAKSKIVDEARDLTKQFANVSRTIKPRRLGTEISGGLLGNTRKAEKELDTLKQQVKPLLQKGLYDDTRALLSEKGFMPEEVESVISNLSESTNKNLAEMPSDIKTKRNGKLILPEGSKKVPGRLFSLPGPGPLDESQRNEFYQNIENVLKQDPKANLILLRKAYEDKGVNWKDYVDALTTLQSEGKTSFDSEQQHAFSTLSEPPLNYLERFLKTIHLTGR